MKFLGRQLIALSLVLSAVACGDGQKSGPTNGDVPGGSSGSGTNGSGGPGHGPSSGTGTVKLTLRAK